MGINEAYSLISSSKIRNEMSIRNVQECVTLGRTPVILTKRKEHAKLLFDLLQESAKQVFLLYGDNSDKQNEEISFCEKHT